MDDRRKIYGFAFVAVLFIVLINIVVLNLDSSSIVHEKTVSDQVEDAKMPDRPSLGEMTVTQGTRMLGIDKTPTDFRVEAGDKVEILGEDNDFYLIRRSDHLEGFVYKQLLREQTEKERVDIDLLARIINAEASNQSVEGKYAVASVVANRAIEYDDSIFNIITAPNQFDGYGTRLWNADYPESTKSIATEVYYGKRNIPSDVLWFKHVDDPTDWSNLRFHKTIDDHDFYGKKY